MKQEEYAERLNELNQRFEAEKKKLATEFALSNNLVSVGDIIEDHMGRIKVDKISVCNLLSTRPMCCYFGPEITKQGNPFKNDKTRWVYQSNLEKINDKKVGE